MGYVEPNDGPQYPEGIAPSKYESNGYPYWSGNTIVLGPECFISEDRQVLSWRGENYVPQTKNYLNNINVMEDKVMEFVVAKGWAKSTDEIPFPEAIALLHSEVSEAMEAWREHGFNDFTSGGTIDHPSKPEGVGSEFADLLIRLLHYSNIYGINLLSEFIRKMDYNETRPYRHGNKRA